MNSLVCPRERFYFWVCLVFSIIVYAFLVFTIVGIVYIVIGLVIGLIVHGFFIGTIKGNGVRVSDNQFPEVYEIVNNLSREMEISPTPEVFILQAGGLLNAFTTRFIGRNFVIIYSDVLELAYQNGEPALGFVVAHELAHIKRKHLLKLWLLYPALALPLLSTAYSRACEYTCDRFAAHYRSDGAYDGLLVLAAGTLLYTVVSVPALCMQASQDRDFWTWFSELFSTHPYLPKRVLALSNLGYVTREEKQAQNNIVPVS